MIVNHCGYDPTAALRALRVGEKTRWQHGGYNTRTITVKRLRDGGKGTTTWRRYRFNDELNGDACDKIDGLDNLLATLEGYR